MNCKHKPHFLAAALMVATLVTYAEVNAQPQEKKSYRDIPSAFRNVVVPDRGLNNRRDRRGDYHGIERNNEQRRFNRSGRSQNDSHLRQGRHNFSSNSNRRIPGARRESQFFSYTSPPLRGGSSRRTRIIENPYSNRLVTGITLTGVDNRQVHIRDVVAYPGRVLVSPLGYSLSQYSPPRFINTYDYIDYISVAAKRKEYFTVTFHYD